jgi:hypothetical protein
MRALSFSLSTIPTRKEEDMRTHSTIPNRSRSAPPRRTAGRGLGRVPRGIPRAARRGLGAYPAVDSAQLGERWLTKREIAAYLRVTPRFIELQQQVGLPVLRMGAVNRYRISEVEAWVRGQYPGGQATGGHDGV